MGLRNKDCTGHVIFQPEHGHEVTGLTLLYLDGYQLHTTYEVAGDKDIFSSSASLPLRPDALDLDIPTPRNVAN